MLEASRDCLQNADGIVVFGVRLLVTEVDIEKGGEFEDDDHECVS